MNPFEAESKSSGKKTTGKVLFVLWGLSLFALNWQQAPAFAVDPAVLRAEAKRVAIIDQVAPSVVAIFGSSGAGGGSGVLISPDGYALSNFHVTSSTGNFMKCGLNDGVVYDAVIVGIDPTGDVALLKLLGRDDFPAATLGNSDATRVGDWVYVMGNPFLLAADFRPTVTYGIVSGVHRYQYPANTFLEYTDCLQVDASINPGNSGGPLFNAEGELIGINGRGSFEKRGRVNVGAGYAISINQIKHFLGSLRSGRIVDHASFGATVTTDVDGAVIIDDILESSDAYRNGLRRNDEIIQFAGRRIQSVNQFKNILGIYPSNWRIPLLYRRDGQRKKIIVRLENLHQESELIPKRRMALPHPDPNPKKKSPKDGNPPQPNPLKKLFEQMKPKKPALPEKYAKLFVEREGFANYYFNTVERERVLDALQGHNYFTTTQSRWNLKGATNAGEEFEMILADKAAALKMGTRNFAQQSEDFSIDEPTGSGGFLTAMQLLRKFFIEDSSFFTEFFYVGTEPLDGNNDQLVDVLHSMRDGVVLRWYFHRDDSRFAGFDSRLSEDVDACEIRFVGWKESNGQTVPEHFHVRRGMTDLFELKLDTLKVIPVSDNN